MSAFDSEQIVENLLPCIGLGCCISSCYLAWPDCCGSRGEVVLLCCESEFLCCKPPRDQDKDIFLCQESKFNCIYPKTCIKAVFQLCCIDLRVALPCDSEVPCLINLLGFTCYFKDKCFCKCCKKLGGLQSAHSASQN